MGFIGFLKYPVVRHFIAGGAIVALLYFFSIAPLQEQNESLRKDLRVISNKQSDLIEKMAAKDTYKIENKINDAKVKKGGEIKLIPENDLKVSNVEVKVGKDTIKKEAQEDDRTWVGRRLKSISDLFKKKK